MVFTQKTNKQKASASRCHGSVVGVMIMSLRQHGHVDCFDSHWDRHSSWNTWAHDALPWLTLSPISKPLGGNDTEKLREKEHYFTSNLCQAKVYTRTEFDETDGTFFARRTNNGIIFVRARLQRVGNGFSGCLNLLLNIKMLVVKNIVGIPWQDLAHAENQQFTGCHGNYQYRKGGCCRERLPRRAIGSIKEWWILHCGQCAVVNEVWLVEGGRRRDQLKCWLERVLSLSPLRSFVLSQCCKLMPLFFAPLAQDDWSKASTWQFRYRSGFESRGIRDWES